MVRKISGHVRNTISLLYKQKTVWNSDIWNFFNKKIVFFQFWCIFSENPLFESGHVWKRHCDVIRWPIFMILVSMERGDPTLYHGTKQLYFGLINFKFIRGVVRGRGLSKSQNWKFYQKCSKYQNLTRFFGLWKKEMTFLTYTVSFKTTQAITFSDSNFLRWQPPPPLVFDCLP